VVLFFKKGAPTRKIWYYELDPGRNLGKTNPLNDADLEEFLTLQKTLADSLRSWSVDVKDIDKMTYDLSVRNPNKSAEVTQYSPTEIMDTIATIDAESDEVLKRIRRISDDHAPSHHAEWKTEKLGELCQIELGRTPARNKKDFWDEDRETENVWLSIADLLNAERNVVSDSREYLSDKGAAITPIVKEGTLLVSFKLTLGRLAFAGRDLRTNEAIAALTILDEKKLSKKYLFYYLQFFDWAKAAEGDDKIKGKTLNKSKLKALQIHYPRRPDQDRIVATLEVAFTETTLLDDLYCKKEDALSALKKSVLKQAFARHV
jgi:hypothetical protein